MMKDKDESGWKVHKGVSLIVLGVLIWLNASYEWLSWSKFVAVIAVLWGIKVLTMGCCCRKK